MHAVGVRSVNRLSRRPRLTTIFMVQCTNRDALARSGCERGTEGLGGQRGTPVDVRAAEHGRRWQRWHEADT